MSANATASNGVPTDESPADFLSDSIHLIAFTTIEGTAYGIMFTLCVICTHLLINNPSPSLKLDKYYRRQSCFVAYIFIMFLLGTMYTASSARAIQLAYVNHRVFPGGPAFYGMLIFSRSNPVTLATVSYMVSNWLADGLIVRYMVELS